MKIPKTPSGGLIVQSSPPLCNPMDCGPPGSFVHGTSQAGIPSGLPVRSLHQLAKVLELQLECSQLISFKKSYKFGLLVDKLCIKERMKLVILCLASLIALHL